MSSSKKTKTQELRERIEALEASVAEQNDTVDAAEQSVADAYAEGRDAAKELDALARAKDELAGKVQALKDLEQRIIKVSREENRERREELAAEARKRYQSAMKAIAKTISPLQGALEKALPKRLAEQTVKSLDTTIRRTVWEHVNAAFSEDYVDFVPAIVKSAPARDVRGRTSEQAAEAAAEDQSA